MTKLRTLLSNNRPPSPSHAVKSAEHTPIPYTIYEALYGLHGLESCVSHVSHRWHPIIHNRLSLFIPILSRPKQAIHHLLELLIIHVCTLPPDPDPVVHSWTTATVDYLARAAHDLIPSNTLPATSVQWYASPSPPYTSASSAPTTPPASPAATVSSHPNSQSVHSSPSRVGPAKRSSQTSRLTPQTEEAFPSNVFIDAQSILHVIGSVTHQLPNPEPHIPFAVLSQLPGLMDEPARTAAITYTWFLHSESIPNGFLPKFIFSSALARRELPPYFPNNQHSVRERDGRMMMKKVL